MARYIDAEKLQDRVKIQTNPYGKPTLEYASGLKVLAMIEQEPTADVAEVKHGYWKETTHITISKRGREIHSKLCNCSNCYAPNGRKKSSYCPHCGAKMDGDMNEKGQNMKVKIWQLLNNSGSRECAKRRFLNFAVTLETYGKVDSEGYSCVYDGELNTNNLEGVYTILNIRPPLGYKGVPLSVSDVVEVDGVGCFFCDSVGFKSVPDFHEKKTQTMVGGV